MPEWAAEGTTRTVIQLAGLLAGSAAVYGLARWLMAVAVARVVRASAITWDDALVEARVFQRLAHVAPALVVYYAIGLVEGVPPELVSLVRRVAIATLVVVVAASLNSFLTALNAIYDRNPEYRHRPIKGYLQVGKILIFAAAALSVVATLLDKSPWLFLSGIGAMTAVLMLIFKDTILSLVASVQLASNDMIHIGDWIEMPQAGADGDVIDVALHTVKVQNWDKTITTIPTHRLISESFKNWRGMQLSGGRRIKRSIHLDLGSVRFLDEQEIRRFGEWALLRDYIRGKLEEIARWNTEPGRNARVNADIRRLTNVGTFRAYVLAYLKAHPKVHHEGYTLIVRQLEPGPEGLPIEIYCFANDQAWERYEGIQADIFDHLIAMVPEFGLRVFQQPSGADVERLAAGPPRSA